MLNAATDESGIAIRLLAKSSYLVRLSTDHTSSTLYNFP